MSSSSSASSSMASYKEGLVSESYSSNEMLSEQLRRKVEAGQVSRPIPSLKRRSVVKTVIFNSLKDQFRPKVMEYTGMHTRVIELPPPNTVEEAKVEVQNEAFVENHKVAGSNPHTRGQLPFKKKVEVQNEAISPDDIARRINSCIRYCALIPTGYEFTKDTLVWLWVAEGLIKAGESERMEDVGSDYFDYLLKWKYVIPLGFDHFSDQVSYKVGDAMISFLEKQTFIGDVYEQIMDGNNFSLRSTHLSLVSEDIDHMTFFEKLKECSELCTLLLLCNCGYLVKNIPRDLFLSLKLLRVLDLSGTHIPELPSSVGNLKSLRYLDVSETPIKRLPETIHCLIGLQILRLRACIGLIGLPKCMNKLINLRHLDLVALRLKSMPKRMGTLVNLQTLRTFIVEREEGCRIGELKNMTNLSGSFCISRLENVLDEVEAREAALCNKQYLKKLTLQWSDLGDEKGEHEDEILECLQPHPGLQELQILFYRGSVLPSWISNPSFANIASVTLYKCRNCRLLPAIGKLPSLKFLSMSQMDRVSDIDHLFCRDQSSQRDHAFPKLEKLTFDVMLSLQEWTGIDNGDFPYLHQLTMKYCPKLSALPFLSRLNSLKHLEISHCPGLSSLPEEGLPASLEFLIVTDCPTIKERCRKGEGEDWFKIAHVCSIYIDYQEISLN